MKSHDPKWRHPLLASGIAALAFGTGVSQAQGKDPREFAPLNSAAAQKRAVGPDDIAKARANASTAPEPAWRSGIIESGLAPFPAAMYQFENQWHEIVDGAHLKVYAGALGKKPSEGVIVVQRISLDNRAEAPVEIRAPAQAGSLRIIAAQGNVLTLRSSKGAEFILNPVTGTLARK